MSEYGVINADNLDTMTYGGVEDLRFGGWITELEHHVFRVIWRLSNFRYSHLGKREADMLWTSEMSEIAKSWGVSVSVNDSRRPKEITDIRDADNDQPS